MRCPIVLILDLGYQNIDLLPVVNLDEIIVCIMVSVGGEYRKLFVNVFHFIISIYFCISHEKHLATSVFSSHSNVYLNFEAGRLGR